MPNPSKARTSVRLGLVLWFAVLATQLVGCGQKGDLYLPDRTPAPSRDKP